MVKDFSKYYKVVSVLCYVQDKGKTLMLYKQGKGDEHEGKHNGLGGKCEPGESPYEAVIREVKEESGLDIVPKFVGHITFKDFSGGRDWECHIFRAEGFEGELLETSPEGELFWVETSKLKDLNLWEADKFFIDHIASEKIWFGNFHYEDFEYKGHKLWFLNN